MGDQAKTCDLGMSDLEHALKSRDISKAHHVAHEGNFGIGDVTRLEIARTNADSMKTADMDKRDIEEIDAVLNRIDAVVRYLKTK